jgi:hypothetical protein
LDPFAEGGVFDPVLRGEAARTLAAVLKGIQQDPALVRGEPQPPDLVRSDQSRIQNEGRGIAGQRHSHGASRHAYIAEGN